MTILREDVEDLGRLGDKEVAKVVEEFEARLKVLKENHTKELETVKSALDRTVINATDVFFCTLAVQLLKSY